MKDAVQHQNLNLLSNAMAIFGCLALGVFKRDRNVAQKTQSLSGRERQHVGGVILLSKVAVQPLYFQVARDQASERASTGHFRCQALGECSGRPPGKSRRGGME